MAVRLAESDDLASREDRTDQAHVAEMRAARIWVVDGVDVAGMHIALECADHVLAGEVQRADVDGDVLIALRCPNFHSASCSALGEVAIVDHERIARPQNLLRHLVDAGDE